MKEVGLIKSIRYKLGSLLNNGKQHPGKSMPAEICGSDAGLIHGNVFELLIKHRASLHFWTYFKLSSPSYCWITP
jgi:hypothetical protein